MTANRQNRIANGAGFNLGQSYRMTNGNTIVPLEVWESSFDGSVMVSYAAYADINDKWERGDSTPATIAYQIAAA